MRLAKVSPRLAIMLMVMVTIMALMPQPVAHAAGVCGQVGSYGAGYTTENTGEPNYRGVSARMRSAKGTTCSGDSSSSINRVLNYISINNGSGGSGYAILGRSRGAGQQEGVLWASYYSNGYTTQNRYGRQILSGATNRYSIRFGTSCNCFEFSLDSEGVFARTAFSPYSSWTVKPWRQYFLAEAKYRESDIPGTAAYPARTDFIQVQWESDNLSHDIGQDPAWGFRANRINNNEARWGDQLAGGTAPVINTWTRG